MYLPTHFRVEDRTTLIEIIQANPLGTLITAGAGGVMANPVPFSVAKGEQGEDLLRAHLARPNPQLAEIAAGAQVLVSFQAEHQYISPNWYPTKAQTHQVVPTWNYIMVQVRGSARIDESPDFLRNQIDRLTRGQEENRQTPWNVDDAPDRFIQMQMRAIVGIEIVMTEVIGKFKLSQNRNRLDQEGVIAGLSGEPNSDAAAMAARMRVALEGKPE
jgi:transcriptional regulator